MSLATRALRRSLRGAAAVLERWRRVYVQAQVRWHGGRLSLPDQTVMKVPLRCNGVGTVMIASGVRLGNPAGPLLGDGGILLQARRHDSLVSIGQHTALSNNVTVIANELVEIGEDCIIGDQVAIYDSDFHELRRSDRDGRRGEVQPVRVGDGVWLGSRVMVLKGVQIGDNAVIASGAVVTKSIPASAIAGGVPAEVIRSIG